MRLSLSLPTLLLATAISAPATAAAQLHQPRFTPDPTAGPFSNTVVRLSVGNGQAGPSGAPSNDRVSGLTLALGAERAIAPHLVGIVEATHWEGNTVGSHATFVTGSAALYPVDGVDAYLRAGFGYGSARVVAPDIVNTGNDYTVDGPAFQYGAGYDYRLSPRVALGAFAVASNTIGSNGRRYVHSGSGNVALLSLGAAFTVRW